MFQTVCIYNLNFLPDPFYIFMDSLNYTSKPISNSKIEDYIEMEALKDLVIGVPCGPCDLMSLP
ncbi:hypothetical protein PITC_008550 [Penicillium italicum]|uniref:Uncharacterized protein n=1 Tax=Penicillium italicum TaxID=40296 RepID=A0A0A2L597_PENIT|nr:hypothetical protein PITC_008550 [Penicillium italicum]